MGTRWKLSAIPLGGYVKFFGDENEASVPDPATLAAMTEEERKHSFFGQSVGRRAAVVVAGPLTNFILAIVIFAGSLHGCRQADRGAAGGCGRGRTAPPPRPASSRATSSLRSMAARSITSSTCSASSASPAATR